MEANELMIGDLVNYRPGWIDEETKEVVYEGKQGFPIRLTCLYDDMAQYDEVLPDGTINTIEVADYELSPIPLSAEILEKIGFIPFDDKSPWITCKWHWEGVGVRNIPTVTITSYEGLDSGVRFLTEIEADCSHKVGINRIHSCDIEYVHELQHALRLCGLEKKIKL